jgi:hypothetical protein
MRQLLNDLVVALRNGNEKELAEKIARLNSDGPELEIFLTSNDLWGGSGSIADQAGVSSGSRSHERRLIEQALIKLGEEQIRLGTVNPRTLIWVSAFKKLSQDGI